MRDQSLLIESVDIYDMSPVVSYLHSACNLTSGEIYEAILLGSKRLALELGHIVENFTIEASVDEWDIYVKGNLNLARYGRHILDIIYSCVFRARGSWTRLGSGDIENTLITLKDNRLHVHYMYNKGKVEKWNIENHIKSI